MRGQSDPEPLQGMWENMLLQVQTTSASHIYATTTVALATLSPAKTGILGFFIYFLIQKSNSTAPYILNICLMQDTWCKLYSNVIASAIFVDAMQTFCVL